MKIELRQLFRSNGLIDNVVVYGAADDYLEFSKAVFDVVRNGTSLVLETDGIITIEISQDEDRDELFTSLQNQENLYHSLESWNARDVLRVIGNSQTLESLGGFLKQLSGYGEGYSYLSEYSEANGYSDYSPEWRLHLEI